MDKIYKDTWQGFTIMVYRHCGRKLWIFDIFIDDKEIASGIEYTKKAAFGMAYITISNKIKEGHKRR